MPISPPDAIERRPTRLPEHRRRQAFGVALLGMGAGLLALVLLGQHEPAGQVQQLPGGVRIELRGWTFGPNHTFVDGRYWQRLLLQAGDAWAVLGGYRATHEDMGNDLVLWFRSDEYEFPGRLLSTAWIDAHGCRISTGSGWNNVLPHGALYSSRRVFWEHRDLQRPESRWIDTPRITPRRGQDPLRYAIVEQGKPEPLASFTVPGARRVSTDTAGRPAALPIRTTVGDTTFLLNDLRHEPEGQHPLSRSSVSFRCEGKGPDSRSWVPVRILCEDGTGNELATLIAPPQPGKRATFETLCRRDPAWKLSVRFARPDPLRLPPDAVRTVRDVRVPRPGEELELSETFSVGGMGVRFEGLRGVDKAADGLDDPTWNSGFFQLNVAAPEGGQLRLLRVTDQNGRVLFPGRGTPNRRFHSVWDLSTNESSGDTPVIRPVDYPSGTRRLNFTFGIYRTRTAEFIVRP